jgi:formiminoglutamase
MSIWDGRIDDDQDFDAFRWHQWIELINLDEENKSVADDSLAFGLIGFRCDEGIRMNKGRIGARKGPDNIRKELRNLPCHFSQKVKIFDAGNVHYETSLASTQEALSEKINQLLSLNIQPIVLGGGHEVAFGHYNGIIKHLLSTEEKPKVGIINFDAHFDNRPYGQVGTSGTMFRQIYDLSKENKIDFSYFCVGIQKHGNTNALFKAAEDMSTEYILAKDITHSNLWDAMMKLDDFITKQEHIYITICADVLSSAFAPGVSAAQPLGLHPEDLLKLLKYILRMNKTISFDIAEVSPRFDMDRSTANLASIIIFSVVNTLSKMFEYKGD